MEKPRLGPDGKIRGPRVYGDRGGTAIPPRFPALDVCYSELQNDRSLFFETGQGFLFMTQHVNKDFAAK